MDVSLRLAVLTALLLLAPGVAFADHGWQDHHWKVGANPPRVVVVKDHTPEGTVWAYVLQESVNEWNVALERAGVPLILAYQDGKTLTCPNTPYVEGAIRVCQKPSDWPWLGATGIDVNGGTHIVSAKIAVKSYDNGGFEDNNTGCHELGHALGLDHGDGKDDDTCVYGSFASYTAPGAHDVVQLGAQYHDGGSHGG